MAPGALPLLYRLPPEARIAHLSEALKGVLAETATAGRVRFQWHLLKPVLHALLDVLLNDYTGETEDEVRGETLHLRWPQPLPQSRAFTAAPAAPPGAGGPSAPHTWRWHCGCAARPPALPHRVLFVGTLHLPAAV